MNDTKINLCRQHWQQLPPHCKDRSTETLERANRPYLAHSCDIPGCVSCGNPPEPEDYESTGDSEENNAISKSHAIEPQKTP